MCNEKEASIELPSGFTVFMSVDSFDNLYRDFTVFQENQLNNYITAGFCFPQIIQYVMVIVTILNGTTSFKGVLLCNLIYGIGNMLLWHWGHFYKTPLLSFLSCLISRNIFKFYFHFIVIAAIAFFVVKDWKVLLFCVISGIITFIVKSVLFPYLTNVKYIDKVVKYVSKSNHK